MCVGGSVGIGRRIGSVVSAYYLLGITRIPVTAGVLLLLCGRRWRLGLVSTTGYNDGDRQISTIIEYIIWYEQTMMK